MECMRIQLLQNYILRCPFLDLVFPCRYVHYCMKFINMLLSHNIKPILVFDGQHLPAKAATERQRHEYVNCFTTVTI
jgi:hypothetical protein